MTDQTDCRGVSCIPPVVLPPSVKGSLILHYENNTEQFIPYDTNIQGCQTIELPQQKVDRIEVAHAKFVLYSGRNGRGASHPVDSIDGPSQYTAEQLRTAGLHKVRSVKIGKDSFIV